MSNPTNRVFIIGAGMVGSTTAFALLLKEVASEIVFMDRTPEVLEAQVMDLEHSVPSTSGCVVRAGDYADLMDDDIVVVTCGAAQKEGQTRLDLIKINTEIITEIAHKIRDSKKNVYLIMVTNPVDIMTYVATKESGLDPERVFGTGTTLDSSRFKESLSEFFKVNPTDVNAYILGEHGDSSFPATSSANIGSVPLKSMDGYDENKVLGFALEAKNAAYKIIAGKKSTYFAIAAVTTDIIKSILRDENKVYPLTSLLNGEFGLNDVCVSVPHTLGVDGAKILDEFVMSEDELDKLNKSAEILKSLQNS